MAEQPAYRRRTYRLPGALEDDLVADLWAAGTLGVESSAEGDRVRVAAWFPASRSAHERERVCTAELGQLEARWRRRGAEVLGEEVIPDQDWLAPWRRQARPVTAGRRFLLDPREPEAGGKTAGGPAALAGEGRIVLRLPARRAFGTGSHESTRLALELLEDALSEVSAPRAPRVLDVGTGTGVLAFVALHLGAGLVVGLDIDPEAVLHARINAGLNDFGSAHPERGGGGPPAPRWFAGGVGALAPGRFDLVVANVLPERILPELGAVLRQLAPAGEMIFSGILETQGSAVLGSLAEHGLTATASRREGEWVAFRSRRRSP